MKRALLLAVAAVLALVAAGSLTVSTLTRPTTLHVAVGPLGGEDVRLMSAFAKALGRGRSDVRLKLSITDGLAASAAALAGGKADLAVARTDAGLGEGLTVLILRRVAATFIGEGGSGLASLADLADGKLGVVRGSRANLGLVDLVLRQHGLDPGRVEKLSLAPSEVRGALAGGLKALVVIGAPTGPTAAEVVATLADASGKAPEFLTLGEAEAIAKRLPTLETIEIERGAFGAAPARPDAAFNTLATTLRLVARPGLDDGVAANLAKAMFAVRPEVQVEVPLAAALAAPEETKGGAFPMHPGAAAWLDGEEQTFFDRYGDVFYIGAMLLSVVGSAAAGLASMAPTARRRRAVALVDEIGGLIAEARGARSLETLDGIECRIDDLVSQTIRDAAARTTDPGMLGVFTLALDHARRAVAENRHLLLARGGAQAAGERFGEAPEEARALLRAGARV